MQPVEQINSASQSYSQKKEEPVKSIWDVTYADSNWGISNFSTVSPICLYFIRMFTMFALMMMIGGSLFTNTFMQFWYYLTSWGAVTSLVALLSSAKAAQYKDWHNFACFANEFSCALNLVITPAFWIALAPGIYESLDYSKGIDIYIAVHMATLHAFPFISQMLNLIMSDVTYVPGNWWKFVILGYVYAFANW